MSVASRVAASATARGRAAHWRRPSRVKTPLIPGYSIVYSDKHLLVVEKESGLLTVPGVLQSDSLITRLKVRGWPSAQVVHRLDRDTSGVLVVALDSLTHSHLSAQFRRQEVNKTYTAIVFGDIKGESGTIDLPIRKDVINTPLQMVDTNHGKPSQTLWRVIERIGARNCTRLELTPLTGRTHQLRLHLSAIGYPICGDDLYADTNALRMAPRLCLHAEQLEFQHPGLNCERMSFAAATHTFQFS